jgi:hypothetical protein
MKSSITQKTLLVLTLCIGLTGVLSAADSELGTWVRTDAAAKGMTMKIEVSGLKARKLTYSVPAQGQIVTMTVESPMDGTAVPILMNGKPNGVTMALTKVDDHHYSCVQKVNGQPMLNSKGTFSSDFNTLTVEDEFNAEMNGQKKQTETWVRK